MLELTQEQHILKETIREFSQNEIAPLASKIDLDCAIPSELLQRLARLGLYGITVPPEFGGVGADFLSLVIASEETSRVCGSLGILLSFHNAVACESLIATGNEPLKQRLLPKLASGTLGTFHFCDGDGVACEILDGNKLVVNGFSKFVAGANLAGAFIVCARLKGKEGQRVLFAFSNEQSSQSILSISEPKKLMGMRGAGFASISFENFELPLDSLLCEVQKSRQYLDQLNSRSRLAVSAVALGITQASLDSEIEYANQRMQFNTKIGNFYAVQDMIAKNAVDIETVRSLCYLTARDIRNGKSIQRDAAIAKVASSEGAIKAARHAIRVHGGYGFTRAYPVERYARDSRITMIYPETNEYLKSFIAQSILGNEI